jgi:hypothetical protein
MSQDLGKVLIIIGLLIALVGIFLAIGGKLNFLGRLSGDSRIERNNFTFFFPLGTCLFISLLLSLILWIFRR